MVRQSTTRMLGCSWLSEPYRWTPVAGIPSKQQSPSVVMLGTLSGSRMCGISLIKHFSTAKTTTLSVKVLSAT
jgi:hypothetical protein